MNPNVYENCPFPIFVGGTDRPTWRKLQPQWLALHKHTTSRQQQQSRVSVSSPRSSIVVLSSVAPFCKCLITVILPLLLDLPTIGSSESDDLRDPQTKLLSETWNNRGATTNSLWHVLECGIQCIRLCCMWDSTCESMSRFFSDPHEGTRMCGLCRHKTGNTSDDMIDHGDKIVNEMVTMINGRRKRKRQSIEGDRFGVADLMLVVVRTPVLLKWVLISD